MLKKIILEGEMGNKETGNRESSKMETLFAVILINELRRT